jgi:DNA-directed RNA polymerase specialized sigma24 family protein
MSSRPSVQPPHAAWLVLPEITDAIEKALRKRGLWGPDLEDHRQSVLERAYVAAEPPGTREECVYLVRKIAREMAIDILRKRRRRSKVDVGPCGDPDERPPLDGGRDGADAIDARRQLALIQRDIESGSITARQAAILTSAVDDVSQLEIAAQMKLAHSTVRNDLAAARRTARRSWAAFAAVTLAVLGLVLWYESRPENVAAPHPGPDESVTPPAPTPQGVAQETRQRALHECALQQWEACLRDLDAARGLDPAGDKAARVVEARDRASRQIESRKREQSP